MRQKRKRESQHSPVNEEEIMNLPVYKEKGAILDAVKNNQIVVLVGETGSGKTTQIPKILMQNKRIVVTQPRRVAAIQIASRVSKELETKLGQLVGYSVRFQDCTSKNTRIKFVTDGMLLRELLTDNMLSKYDIIILDEAHERTLRTDILFGAIKGILKKRPKLKLIVMSATLNAISFSKYFDNAPVVEIPGRMYPVVTFYASEKQSDHIDAALVSVMQIHKNKEPGDILVFLTGQEDIENLEKLLNEQNSTLEDHQDKLLVCPIFAALPTSQQTLVFEKTPPSFRKVVIATNIAETSITISGIRYVVDTGLVKVRSYNPKTGIDILEVQAISKAAAKQRAGRAGREAAGICYRLYTEASFRTMEEETEPEIKRCNLASVILLLKSSGIENIIGFDFMDKPSRNALISALEQLYALKALDATGKISEIGIKMSMFPIDPTYAKVIMFSQKEKCCREAIDIVSMLSVEPIFFSPSDKREESSSAKRKFMNFDGDHLTLLNVMREYAERNGDPQWCFENFINSRSMKQVMDIRKQLESFCRQQGIDPNISCGSEYSGFLKCILAGFFKNVALRQQDGSFKTLGSREVVHIHPASVLFQTKQECVMFTEWVKTSRSYLRNCSLIQPNWLSEVAPHYYRHNSMTTFN